MGMTDEEVKGYIKRRLGDGIVDVELTPDHLNDILRTTKRWFATRVGVKDFRQILLSYGTQIYKMDDDVIEVIKVILPSTQFPSIDTDDFSYSYSLMFGSQWTTPGSTPMPYSDLVQRLQYLEMAQRIFSADRDWAYDKRRKELNIMPTPVINGFGLVEVWSGVVDPRDLDLEDEDLFLRYMLGEAKMQLGDIRRKFSQYTTVAGERNLNGEIIMQEGMKEKEQCNKDALNWKRATPFIVG